MDLSRRFRKVAVEETKYADILDGTRWASDFQWKELQILGAYMELFSAPEGTIFFEQGERDLFMCLIVEGEVRIWKEDSDFKKQVLATIGKDSTLGEMALIDNQPRSAAAVAAEDTTMFILTKQRFEEMADTHPKLWGSMLLKFGKLMSQRLRETSGVLVDYL